MTDTYTPALTNEQIAKVIHDRVATKILAGEPIDPQDWFDYARAIERAAIEAYQRQPVALERRQPDLLPALAALLGRHLVGVLAQRLAQGMLFAQRGGKLGTDFGFTARGPLDRLAARAEYPAVALAKNLDLGAVALRGLLDARHVGLERGLNGAGD